MLLTVWSCYDTLKEVTTSIKGIAKILLSVSFTVTSYSNGCEVKIQVRNFRF